MPAISANMLNEYKRMAIFVGVTLLVAAIISWLQIRTYGIILLALMGWWLQRTFWPNITVEGEPICSESVKRVFGRYLQLRKEKKEFFYFLTLLGTGFLFLLGSYVSGPILVLFVVIGAAARFSRHQIIINRIDESQNHDMDETYASGWSYVHRSTAVEPEKTYGINAEQYLDEFLPEQTEANNLVLEQAVKQLSQTQYDTNSPDEIPSDLMPDSIPEMDEHSDGSSDDENNGLLNIAPPASNVPTTRSQPQYKGVTFQRDNSPSALSSSSSDSITSGLDFNMVDGSRSFLVAHDAPSSSATTQSANTVFSTMLTALVGQSKPQPTHKHVKRNIDERYVQDSSSDDSEFEMLNHDELQQLI